MNTDLLTQIDMDAKLPEREGQSRIVRIPLETVIAGIHESADLSD